MLRLGAYKFHLRAHVLAVGDLDAWVHDDIVALCAAAPYRGASTADTRAHATNLCARKRREKKETAETKEAAREREAEAVATLEELCASVPLPTSSDGSTPTTPETFATRIRSAIREVASDLFLAARGRAGGALGFFPTAGCFELFGLDFLLDEKGDARLLEVNSDPSLAVFGERLKDTCARTIADILDVALPEVRRARGFRKDDVDETTAETTRRGGFELVAREPPSIRGGRRRRRRKTKTRRSRVRRGRHRARRAPGRRVIEWETAATAGRVRARRFARRRRRERVGTRGVARRIRRQRRAGVRVPMGSARVHPMGQGHGRDWWRDDERVRDEGSVRDDGESSLRARGSHQKGRRLFCRRIRETVRVRVGVETRARFRARRRREAARRASSRVARGSLGGGGGGGEARRRGRRRSRRRRRQGKVWVSPLPKLFRGVRDDARRASEIRRKVGGASDAIRRRVRIAELFRRRARDRGGFGVGVGGGGGRREDSESESAAAEDAEEDSESDSALAEDAVVTALEFFYPGEFEPSAETRATRGFEVVRA